MSAFPTLTKEQIAQDCAISTGHFRHGRIQEPLESYLEVFDEYQTVLEELLERTVDLTRVREEGTELLLNPKAQEALST